MLRFMVAFDIKIIFLTTFASIYLLTVRKNILICIFSYISLLQINRMYIKALRMKGELWEIQVA